MEGLIVLILLFWILPAIIKKVKAGKDGKQTGKPAAKRIASTTGATDSGSISVCSFISFSFIGGNAFLFIFVTVVRKIQRQDNSFAVFGRHCDSLYLEQFKRRDENRHKLGS